MQNVNYILNQVRMDLTELFETTDISFKYLMTRPFSIIYEIILFRENRSCFYILKISTTTRSCEKEYEQYRSLAEADIQTLVPILHSKEHNYIITKKEELTRFDDHIAQQRNLGLKLQNFYKLGEFFAHMDTKTGRSSSFNSSSYEEYVLPRLNTLRNFSRPEKQKYAQIISNAALSINEQETRNCLVSDFSFSNINIDKNDGILILDMGDACHGNRYDNIAYLQLLIEFGSLKIFSSSKKVKGQYFKEFLRGYGIYQVDKLQLSLYRVKHLVNMIAFINNHKSNSKKLMRRVASSISNRFLIRIYIRQTKQVLRELI